MTRRCMLLVSLAGCSFFESSTAPTPTPTPDAGVSSCENPGVACSASTSEFCNHNNQTESCWELEDPAVCRFRFVGEEQCDGTDVTSCHELGFYDGTVVCDNCKVDTTACDVCVSTVSCASVEGFSAVHEPVVSGTYVALAGADALMIFSGLTPVTEVSIPKLQALAGVPGGWLVATDNPPSLSTLDYAGLRGSPQALPPGAGQPLMVSNSAGRVIIVWTQPVFAQQYLMCAIADANGNIIVPSTRLFPIATSASWDATSAGTSFFVGGDGALARVSETGAVTITTGFVTASSGRVHLVWGGTFGWYVNSSYGFDAQPFDASGAAIGTYFYDINLADSFDFLADGDDLLAVQANVLPSYVWIVVIRRFAASGLVTEQHIGALGLSSWSWWARAAHFGTGTVVMWSFGDKMTLGLVP